jgi:dihydrofolate reductase
MIISHIVACDINGVIGDGKSMPWHLPEDLKHFKAKTLHHCVLMGRKTFESLPNPLSGRIHIVVSSSFDRTKNIDENIFGVPDIPTGVELASYMGEEELFIIGGGTIYSQTMDMVDKVYLTLIQKEYQGNVKYPLSRLDYPFLLVSEDKVKSKKGVELSFQEYRI